MAFIAALRPKQWTKNLLVYFPLFFTVGERWSPQEPGEALDLIARSTAAFVLLTVISGAVYLINDVADLDSDRRHLRKRLRPIASGRLGVRTALAAASALGTAGIAASFALEALFGWVVVGYAALMVAYSLLLKRVALLDVITIAGGFLLRVVAGAAVLGVMISHGSTPVLAGRTLHSSCQAQERGSYRRRGRRGPTRNARRIHTAPARPAHGGLASSALLAYTLYTFTASNLPDNHAMMLTIPFVVFGLFRYTYQVHKGEMGEDPADMLTADAPLLASVLLWLVTVATILVLSRT